MSAYLHRLLTRDSEPSLAPLVHSHSPVAAIDQRLALDESLGHGLLPLDEPDPQPITVPTPGADSVEPAPVLRRKAEPGLAPSPSTPSPPTQHETRSSLAPSPTHDVALAPGLAPPARPPKLDPGPLFGLAPEPAHFDEQHLDAIVSTPARARNDTRPQVHAPAPTHAREVAPLVAPTPLAPAPLVAPASRIDPAPRIDPTPQVEPSPASPRVTPQLEPAPRLEPTPRIRPLTDNLAPLPRLEPLPRPRDEPTPTPSSAAPASPASRPAPTPKPAPKAERAPRPTQPKRATTRPRDIESLSQIGPLERHFPLSRALRLRYR